MRALFLSARISVAHEQGHQWFGANLSAPVPVHGGVKRGTFGQGVGRIEKLTRPKNARAAVLQKNLHLPAQHKQPLRVTRAMESAAKTHRALAQLASRGSHQGRQLALWGAFSQGHKFVTKTGTAIHIGEENGFFQLGHGGAFVHQNESTIVAQPTGPLPLAGSALA